MATRLIPPALVVALVALALGAITSVVVAWMCAFLVPEVVGVVREATRYPNPPDCGLKARRVDGRAGFDIHLQTGTIIESTPSPNSAPGDVDRLVPEWSRRSLVPWGWTGGWQIGQWSHRRTLARGWPMPAMHSTLVATVWSASEGVGTWRNDDGLALDRPSPPTGFSTRIPRVLPTRIVVVGFVVDTVAYSVAWGVMLGAVVAIRRGIRRRDGRCAGCGYDRRTIDAARPCPECGAAG